MPSRGFTLVEMLIVIAIIGVLAATILIASAHIKDRAYFARMQTEIRTLGEALQLYLNKNNSYPPDANRDLPPGLEAYLSGGNWPKAPWPGSVYDWDSWAPDDLIFEPTEQVRQISVRFCPLDQPTQCSFPLEPWAENFDYYSAVYYCIEGPCRAHPSQPVSHPGLCLNC